MKRKDIKFLIFLINLLLIVAACKSDLNKTKNTTTKKNDENIFKDEMFQTIYSLQDDRNSTKLLKYLNNEYPEYRKAAVIAFASIQDSMTVMPVSALLNDDNEKVRNAVAYTLGQIRHKSAEQLLIDAFQKEKSQDVKKTMLEAIGKCGTEKGLNFVSSFSFQKDELLLLTGQAWGLSRFAMQNKTSKQSTAKAIELLTMPNISEKVRYIVSFYFGRSKGLELTDYQDQLIEAFNTEGYLYTRMNVAAAMGKCKQNAILYFLIKILKSEYDYRIKLNAMDALRKFEYASCSEPMYDMLKDANINLAIKASEYFIEKGSSKEAKEYFEVSRKLTNWRVRTNMLTAALKFADAADKEGISTSIISGFQVAENIYEKANLLKALSGDVMNYKFIETQIFSSKEFVIKSYGMDALAEIRRNPKFDEINKNVVAKKGDNLYDDFGLIFKKAIQSRDGAMIAIAAEVMREPSMKYNEHYKNTYFLTQALNDCQLPQDIEAYIELQKTISYINGSPLTEVPKVQQNPIDWKLVTSILPNQKVLIKTTKGNITLQLMVNEAPGSVENFVKLIKQNYYNGNAIHRAVPGFVIQDGCPRGDGWGGPGFSIRSEFPPLYYQEGSVGMASAGKDTESSQWFICSAPTAHLDGRYTIFATVIDGLKIIHEIEIGDKIISMELQ